MANKALIIGVWRYHDSVGIEALRAVKEDIESFAKLLREHGEFEDPRDVVVLPNPGMPEANTAIDQLFHESNENDLRLLYYSGHGYRHDEAGRKPRLCLALPETDSRRPHVNCIRGDEIKNYIESESCRSKRIAVILDCCHAEAISSDSLVSKDLNIVEVENKELVRSAFQFEVDDTRSGGAYVLCSSMVDQKSFERQLQDDPKRRESMFTKTLVDGLKNGEVSPDSEFINLEHMRDYAQKIARQSRANYMPVLLNLRSRSEPSFPLLKNPVTPIPSEIRDALKSPDRFCRLGAVAELDNILEKSSPELPTYRNAVSLLNSQLDRTNDDHETHDNNRFFIKRVHGRHTADQRPPAARNTIKWKPTSLLSDLVGFLLLFVLSITFTVFFSILPGGEIPGFVRNLVQFSFDNALISNELAGNFDKWIVNRWCSATEPLRNSTLWANVVASGSIVALLIVLIHKLLRPSKRRSLLIILPLSVGLYATVIKTLQIHGVAAKLTESLSTNALEEQVFGCYPPLGGDVTTSYAWSYVFGLSGLTSGLQIILVSMLLYLFLRVLGLSRQQGTSS